MPSDSWCYHYDALGTTLATTSHSGQLLQAYSALPWGELGGGTSGTSCRLDGMRLGAETMLHNATMLLAVLRIMKLQSAGGNERTS